LSAVLLERKVSRVLLVTDKGLIARGLQKKLMKALENADVLAAIYDATHQNPTIENIEEALDMYHNEGCTAIIALGGGSPMDCAKGVGACVARPGKTIQHMRGQLKVLRKMPLFIAVPTTAGSGSETTVACVVRDGTTNEKYAVNDPVLIPHFVLHDPTLTANLPPDITATTGMDALCHAVEAYIGKSNTHRTQIDAIKATRIIFRNLYNAYTNGLDLKARANMQKAAFLAGAAFTRAYVGNIHAIGHTLGGQYNTPHGLANAVIMPYVLEKYGSAAQNPLAELAIAAGLADKFTPKGVAAKMFISAIRGMNEKMNIPTYINGLRDEDIPTLAERALREANPLYPVPVIFNKDDMEEIYLKIKGECTC